VTVITIAFAHSHRKKHFKIEPRHLPSFGWGTVKTQIYVRNSRFDKIIYKIKMFAVTVDL